ncbi:MAG: zinc ribbon domain-containing protein [Thermoflexales bacterium]|nr:zinc ribbon domain-containing protein [Thermoflexales bacterium]
MPIYEYRCLDCNRKLSVFWRTLSSVDDSSVRCDRCGSQRVTRLVSRVRVLRRASSDLGGGDSDDALLQEMENLDENDPRALGRLMRRMAEETGEDMGPEFNEIVSRLERGEDPERIEKDMEGLLGAPEGDEFPDESSVASSSSEAGESSKEE